MSLKQDLALALLNAGPLARAMRIEEFDVLTQAADLVSGCEIEVGLAGLPDDLAAWVDDAEFTEDD